MSGNPLTEKELLALTMYYAKKGLPVQLPEGYVLASPASVPGVVAWRKLDGQHISTGIIPGERLGTGYSGTGDLVLHDDGTWKPVSGCVTIDFGLRTDPTVQYDLGTRDSGVYLDFCNRL